MSNPWSITAVTEISALPEGVLSSWSALYQRCDKAGVVPNNLALPVWTESIRQLLARGAVMYLAINPAKPDHWLGYALTEQTSDGVPIVHLAFVKPNYRRNGVMSDLLAAAGVNRQARLFYTFATGREGRFYPAGRYEPGIARRKVA